jgi:hypothetical protein
MEHPGTLNDVYNDTMVATAPKLGVGLYTLAEAAFYARLNQNTLSRWLYGSSGGEAVLRPEGSDERFVTFVDFIEAMAVRAIRLEHKLKLDKVRQAVRVAANVYGVTHPLAQRHITYLFDNEIFICLPNTNTASPAERYFQASGKHKGVQLMKPIVEVYLDDIGFDPDGVARTFSIFERNKQRVLMDPKIHFGEPRVPSGYSFMTLWEASTSEGSMEAAAKAYGVPVEEVALACHCYDHLKVRGAA